MTFLILVLTVGIALAEEDPCDHLEQLKKECGPDTVCVGSPKNPNDKICGVAVKTWASNCELAYDQWFSRYTECRKQYPIGHDAAQEEKATPLSFFERSSDRVQWVFRDDKRDLLEAIGKGIAVFLGVYPHPLFSPKRVENDHDAQMREILHSFQQLFDYSIREQQRIHEAFERDFSDFQARHEKVSAILHAPLTEIENKFQQRLAVEQQQEKEIIKEWLASK